jgi:RNA polymerase sigma factor (TIGR02999 family)
MEQIARILESIRQGNSHASEALFPLVYDELRKLAAARLESERPGQTLQPTALVHEVYMRLVAPQVDAQWDSVGHFFAAAAEAMRRILVENARRKLAVKRGGAYRRVDAEMERFSDKELDDELIELDDALNELSRIDPVKARLVELRFFGGRTLEECCPILGISRTTAARYWSYARAWLFQRLSPSDGTSFSNQ